MEQGLRSVPAWKLDKFIEDYLLPDTTFGADVKSAVNVVCDFLKERCFQGAAHPVRVCKVVKSGSFDSDTDIKDTTEVNITVFLKGLNCYKAVYKCQGEFLKEIKKQLCKLPGEKKFQLHYEVQNPEEPSPLFLSFKLSSPELQQEVECRAWLVRKVLGQVHTCSKPDPIIYAILIWECTSLGKDGEFSTCFTELQRNFLKQRPAKLKSLIRLVKHWYQLCKEKLGKPLPPQYALELLTVFAWEQGNGCHEFNTAQGFRTVLELVTKYQHLRIYWTKYYDFEHKEVSKYLHRQLRKARPVILDPADPTGNVAGGNPEGWRRLAEEADVWLWYPCFMKIDGSRVSSWDVPTVVPVPFEQVEENWTCILL
ncbi:2'-5'-oligoadenylate synthase 1A-like [Mus caroli]|uniref:2'-5'-oligoadenylate synthase 1A-like n=1 Tax=Mus caroli TaxID=10089 RepID=A0A6P5PUL0_MUSCR|nr:2'-5'-oligoadenylate synthase 1A-like [Mus caroli]